MCVGSFSDYVQNHYGKKIKHDTSPMKGQRFYKNVQHHIFHDVKKQQRTTHEGNITSLHLDEQQELCKVVSDIHLYCVLKQQTCEDLNDYSFFWVNCKDTFNNVSFS